MVEEQTGGFWEWVLPLAFIVCAGWVIWHMPAFILDFLPPENPSLLDQISSLHARKDVAPQMAGLFGGTADILDWAALLLIPVIFLFGTLSVRVAAMEYPDWRAIDRVGLFIGRVTMMLVLLMTLVMMYEVFLRYALEKPTLWANELTLWLAGFVFLCSGFYAMQQRCHIRIFLIYERVPRWMQHTCDILSSALICLFAFFLVFGSFKQVFVIKFYRWEMFGTAFDPPIPATIQPMILIIVTLIAIQSVLNLIADWNIIPEEHGPVDLDDDELEAIKRSVGSN
ncbi:TRAP transporter small permease subunit [Yoonia sp. SS1-5]|uniref:TRAP transporter small permease protein n=1 Tax=Yoonia rhodophyticola TaxID=3137370 RepID=A0AAN0MB41_9RHOB